MNAIHLLRSFKHGGGETVAYNYSRILSKLGVSNTFVAQQESQLFEEMLKKVGQTKYSYGISDVRNADLIFVNSTIDLIKLCLYRMLPLGWSKKKVIYTQHLNKSESKFRLISMLVNFCCTDFIQITPFTKHLVEKYIKVRVNFIVNFYLKKHNIEDWPKIRKDVRTENNIDSNKIVVMFSAALKPGKNVEDFIELARKSQHDGNFVFLLAGDGPESHYVKKYEGNNLIWLGNVNDVERYLIASDVYIFTSKWEMMPMALLEAIITNKYIMAYDIPVSTFLLGKTYNVLSYKLLCNYESLPNGINLEHYDEAYALKAISRMIGVSHN